MMNGFFCLMTMYVVTPSQSVYNPTYFLWSTFYHGQTMVNILKFLVRFDSLSLPSAFHPMDPYLSAPITDLSQTLMTV